MYEPTSQRQVDKEPATMLNIGTVTKAMEATLYLGLLGYFISRY